MKISLSKAIALLLFTAFLMVLYPAFVLGYTWSHVAHSNLSGGRNGPLDAYRHTLASAVVAYTLDKRAVDWVSSIMESGHSSANAMDKRNNSIGAGIGSTAISFIAIEPAVRQAIDNGTIGGDDPRQITWLAENQWQDSLFW